MISINTRKFRPIIFLALFSAFVPLSTDLCLPALPDMTTLFNVSEFTMNLTLILFFIFYSVATIIWGPLSDRYGRRPMLLVGLTIYMIGSILCGIANSAWEIIFFRILQAIGGGVANHRCYCCDKRCIPRTETGNHVGDCAINGCDFSRCGTCSWFAIINLYFMERNFFRSGTFRSYLHRRRDYFSRNPSTNP